MSLINLAEKFNAEILADFISFAKKSDTEINLDQLGALCNEYTKSQNDLKITHPNSSSEFPKIEVLINDDDSNNHDKLKEKCISPQKKQYYTYETNTLNATKIQKVYRGRLKRKELLKLKDEININNLIEYIKGYNKILEIQDQIKPKNKNHKQFRKINYPSDITENIAKFAIATKYNVMANWNTKPGDLKLLTKQIEVKGGFIENGPPTFGPKEKWDWIYFVDCKDTFKMNFKVYEIKKNNEHFRNLKVNKNETFGDHCDQKRRPRLIFSDIKTQLGIVNCKLIFDGHISQLI